MKGKAPTGDKESTGGQTGGRLRGERNAAAAGRHNRTTEPARDTAARAGESAGRGRYATKEGQRSSREGARPGGAIIRERNL